MRRRGPWRPGLTVDPRYRDWHEPVPAVPIVEEPDPDALRDDQVDRDAELTEAWGPGWDGDAENDDQIDRMQEDTEEEK